MFNRLAFNASLAVRGFSVQEAAKTAKFEQSKLYRRLQGDGQDFTLGEIEQLVNGLKFSKEETLNIFFAK